MATDTKVMDDLLDEYLKAKEVLAKTRPGTPMRDDIQLTLSRLQLLMERRSRL